MGVVDGLFSFFHVCQTVGKKIVEKNQSQFLRTPEAVEKCGPRLRPNRLDQAHMSYHLLMDKT